MNLAAAIQLMSRLPIKHVVLGTTVPFVPNPNQEVFYQKIAAQQEHDGLIRAIVLKARRVGISSASDGLLGMHCLARSQAHAKIVAHRADTAEGLFRVPRDLLKALPFSCGEIMVRKIIVSHPTGNSVLDIATAGSVSGGRGLTLSALHLSEAAQFPGDDSFLALLPAVSTGPDSMVFVESTANGRVGLGKAFYEFWVNSVKGKTGYVPIFLSWLDDPGCRREAAEAPDAPATDIERALMAKPFCANHSQIAWFRHTLESQCQGLLPKMMQEYPHSPEVAFISSGDPAFTEAEIAYVRSTADEPLIMGHLELKDGRPEIVASRRGALHVWELPHPNHKYYIGADAASGVEDGDFAAYAIVDGTDGRAVARFAERVHPEALARELWMAGILYNKALINIELTGGLGRVIQRILRDDYHYSELYGWKGKDDRPAGTVRTHAARGWETSSYSRRILIDNFRLALRAGIHKEPGGIEIYDASLIDQMDLCTLTEGMQWEVERGHDDILFAYMLAVTTCIQYPPPRVAVRSRKMDPEHDGDPRSRMPILVKNELPMSLGDHIRQVERAMKRAGRPEGLEGI